jgi:NAD-dependent deacetylase
MLIDLVAGWLRSAERIAVLSGAGLSKASGIPTYRDAGGLWTQASTARFSSAMELARDPEGFRAFWARRRREVALAQPNAGHVALAELQQLKPATALITQNIDGLLTRAGATSVLEIHGNLQRDRCGSCGAVVARPIAGLEESPARCPSCSATDLRPDVVMFGEYLDARLSAEADYASKRAEVFLLVGTSAVVYPAAGWAEKAVSRGAKLAVVNLEATPLDGEAGAVIHGRTEEVLPQMLAQMKAGA